MCMRLKKGKVQKDKHRQTHKTSSTHATVYRTPNEAMKAHKMTMQNPFKQCRTTHLPWIFLLVSWGLRPCQDKWDLWLKLKDPRHLIKCSNLCFSSVTGIRYKTKLLWSTFFCKLFVMIRFEHKTFKSEQ